MDHRQNVRQQKIRKQYVGTQHAAFPTVCWRTFLLEDNQFAHSTCGRSMQRPYSGGIDGSGHSDGFFYAPGPSGHPLFACCRRGGKDVYCEMRSTPSVVISPLLQVVLPRETGLPSPGKRRGGGGDGPGEVTTTRG